MKVAVMSSQGMQCGKTAFCLMLSMLFSRTQHRPAALLSTKDMGDYFSAVETKSTNSILTSIEVVHAEVTSRSVRGDEILDYGVRIGKEQSYIFDIYNSANTKYVLDGIMKDMFKNIKTDMLLVEIGGSEDDEMNQHILQNADVILYLFSPSNQDVARVKTYMKERSPEILKKTGYVCSMYDQNAVSEKRLAKMLGTVVSNIMLFPYNATIIKAMLQGDLNTLTVPTMQGHPEVVNMRRRLVEVMQYLYDSSRVKYIKDINTWDV